MSAHDKLAKAGIVPTIDAEKAYRLGQESANTHTQDLHARLERLERILTEISLMAGRAR
jgi:hypothetical protein